MAKYNELPKVIEATQWFKNGDHPNDNCKIIKSTIEGNDDFLSEGEVVRYYRTPEIDGEVIIGFNEKRFPLQ